MARTPGSGRRPGSRNKFTGEFRHAVQLAFENIGGVEALSEWARKPENTGAFLKICARLIPGEMAARAAPLQYNVIVDRSWKLRDQEARNHAAPVTFEYSAPAELLGKDAE